MTLREWSGRLPPCQRLGLLFTWWVHISWGKEGTCPSFWVPYFSEGAEAGTDSCLLYP